MRRTAASFRPSFSHRGGGPESLGAILNRLLEARGVAQSSGTSTSAPATAAGAVLNAAPSTPPVGRLPAPRAVPVESRRRPKRQRVFAFPLIAPPA